jgi:hypothetical protein
MSKPMNRSRLSCLRAWAGARRRGVVSVVAMMFLILFGSLAAAMAIMSKGNIITAATHQHVMRAQGAAETGLAVAAERLAEAAGRVVVEKGTVDSGFGLRLWNGTFVVSDGQVTRQPPRSYPATGGAIPGLAHAVAEVHAQDNNTITVNGIISTYLTSAPAGADPTEYSLSNWVRTRAVALGAGAGGNYSGTAFQIDYAPLANGTDVRAIVTGYDFGYTTRGEPVTRRIVQDFRIVKRVEAAVLSPSRIMIGKNVVVEGNLGAAFTDVDQQFGDPLTMKSDFWGLEAGLDAELTKLFNALAAYDVDKDNRLRIGHPIEGAALPDYSNLGYPGAAADVTGDGYLDEFDVFIMYYDANHDGKVVLSAAMAAGTPAEGQTPEFVKSNGQPVDDDLAYLLDSGVPDRNRNGEARFVDNNHNGRFEPGVDDLVDQEVVDPSSVPAALQGYIHNLGGQSVLFRDQVLGFRDGVIDRRDQYKKVHGRLVFRVGESQWIAGQGNYMQRVRGPISPTDGLAPVSFATGNAQLPDLTNDNFTNSQTALRAAANGGSFDQQVADNLGVSLAQLPTWTLANNPSNPSAPRHNPLRGDANYDGLPDNWQTAHFERMPFNSPSYYDWYYRPVYENMTFRNVQIPPGTNALFKNCTFVGVTYVRSRVSNGHALWAAYGRMKMGQGGRPVPDVARTVYTGGYPPAMLDPSDTPVLMAANPMDKADVPANEVPQFIGYSSLPDPLIIDGRRCIDTKKVCNNIRFHDCLFVGSIVSDNPDVYTHTRNKLQFTGGTRFTQQHPEQPNNAQLNPNPGDLGEIAKSSMMLPNYSVDIGSFNSPPTQDVRLRGAIVAGVMDVRGNASIDGALLLTFRPVLGQAPLTNASGNPAGNPSMFNATLGYFGPEDGDDESLDPRTLPIVNGVPITGWDLDGDGIADLGPNDTPTAAQLAAGATAVPFYGYGHVTLRFDPNMALPDGIMLPLQVRVQRGTYKETSK